MKLPIDIEWLKDSFTDFSKLMLTSSIVATASTGFLSLFVLAITFFTAGTFHPVYPIMLIVRIFLSLLWLGIFVKAMQFLSKN